MISIKNISKSAHAGIRETSGSPATPGLHQMSVEIPDGALFGVLDPSGTSASSLARILALEEQPDTGAVHIDGADPAPLDVPRRGDTARVLSSVDPSSVLHPERTAAGNIAAPMERFALDAPTRRDRVADVLDLVGLSRGAGSRPSELNEGQRRRVALARALVVRPSVLIVDRLTDGLATDEAGALLAALDRAWAELGVTIVVATSEAGVVRRICDSVAVLADGRLLETGSVLELLSDQRSYLARTVLPGVDRSVDVGADLHSYDRLVDAVLIGHAAVGALLADVAARFGVELATLGGGLTRVADTPIGRFRLGVSGERSRAAVGWIAEHGGHVVEVQLPHEPAVSMAGTVGSSRVRELVAAGTS